MPEHKNGRENNIHKIKVLEFSREGHNKEE